MTIWMCGDGNGTPNHVAVVVEPVEEQLQLNMM